MSSSRGLVRGSEATASVRLRRRKDANPAEGTKKRNRHSGDFFVWNSPTNQAATPNTRQSGDWGHYTPASGAPSSLVAASTTRQSYAIPEDATTSSMPYSPVVAAAIAAHRQQPRVSGGRIDEEDNLMETLDRKIPPSLRPILRDNNRFLDTSSDFVTTKTGRHYSGNQRRSCDVSQFRLEDYQKKAEMGKKRPLSVVASPFTNIINNNNNHHNHYNGSPHRIGLSAKDKKFAKSTDGVHHLMKRSYPELREAVSEVEALDTMFETTTNVSTVVAQQSCVSTTPGTTVCKGLLWQQRDKIFSRWKERFFILTQDYLQCFKKGSSKMTEMGGFIFKLKLSDVSEVELLDKKGYLTVSLILNKEGKILLRKPEGIREWFASLKECVQQSKDRKGLMKSTKEFWSKRQFTDSSPMEQYTSKHRDRGAARRHHRSNGGLFSPDKQTTDYGFIDAPPKAVSEANVKLAVSSDALNMAQPLKQLYEPPPPYSGPEISHSHLINTRDSSASNKSQDSGIDSIEKQHGRMSTSEKIPNCSTSTSSSSSPGSDSRSSGIGGGVVIRNHRHNTPMERMDPAKRHSEYLNDVVDKFPQLWVKRDRASCHVGSRLQESGVNLQEQTKPNRNSMIINEDYYYRHTQMRPQPGIHGQLRPQVTKL